MSKDDSLCNKKRNILCQFDISRNLSDALIEVCVFCGKRVIYNKDEKGNLDSKKYVLDHIRDTLQPYGRTAKLFKAIYGEGWVKDVQKRFPKKKNFGSWDDVWKESRNFVKRKTI